MDAGPDKGICFGENTGLHGLAWGDPFATAYTYSWTPLNGIMGTSTDQDIVVNPVATTWFHVKATTNFGCEGPDDSV